MPTRWDASRTALASIAEAVGRTPLVRLNRVTAGVKPEILLKIEWYGPTGSLKDRIYLHMFERAEARGELTRGMRVLECSTGNAGIACAFVAAVKGYACTIVMPEGMSDERKKLMRAYGADLVFTPGGESDVDLALARLAEIRAGDPAGYWVPGQFDNADNVEAHYRTTGPEIWEQCGGRVGAFVAAQGSGGTPTGGGRPLPQRDPRVQPHAVGPDEGALLARRHGGWALLRLNPPSTTSSLRGGGSRPSRSRRPRSSRRWRTPSPGSRTAITWPSGAASSRARRWRSCASSSARAAAGSPSRATSRAPRRNSSWWPGRSSGS